MADLALQGIHKLFGNTRVLHEIDIHCPMASSSCSSARRVAARAR